MRDEGAVRRRHPLLVKAVGAGLNPDSPTLFRREVLALGLLGSHPLWADLLASYDDGDWVALVLEDVDGTHPDLGDDPVMARLVEATDQLVRVMQERVPAPPAPSSGPGNPLFREGLTDLRAVFHGWASGLDHAPEMPPDLIPSWVVERTDELRAGVVALADGPTDHLVHYDIRNDNLLVRPTGEIVFLDWGACGVGPDWLDPLLARLERVHLPWFDTSLATSPALARAGDDVCHLVAGRRRLVPRLPRPHRRRREPADPRRLPASGVTPLPRCRGSTSGPAARFGPLSAPLVTLHVACPAVPAEPHPII